MHHIAICDDETAVRRQIREMLTHHPQASSFVITEFESGEALCESLQAGQAYLMLILDIQLEQLNGVGVGRFLRSELQDSTTQVLYISGFEKYAMELFQVRPLNFLIKPIDEARLLANVSEAIRLCPRTDSYFTFSTSKTTMRIPLREIRYFESYNKKLLIHTVRGDFECYQKLSDVLETLPHEEFIQIHQSFVVQYHFVQHIRYDTLMLDNEKALPISQAYRKAVRERIFHQLPKGV